MAGGLYQVDFKSDTFCAGLDAVDRKKPQRSDKSYQACDCADASSKTWIMVHVPVAWLAGVDREKHPYIRAVPRPVNARMILKSFSL